MRRRTRSPACHCELEKVVGGADHGPFAPDLIEAAQEELAEASGMLDLSEHRLDHLLSQPVTAAPPGSPQPLGHRAHQGSLGQLSAPRGMRLAVARSARRQVAFDATLLLAKLISVATPGTSRGWRPRWAWTSSGSRASRRLSAAAVTSRCATTT